MNDHQSNVDNVISIIPNLQSQRVSLQNGSHKNYKHCLFNSINLVPGGIKLLNLFHISRPLKLFRSGNTIKNKFYGGLRKLIRKINQL